MRYYYTFPNERHKIRVLRGEFAHFLVRLSKRIMPPGHQMSAYYDQQGDIRVELACCGLRLGVVEPLMKLMGSQISTIADVQKILASLKMYEISDRLRDVVKTQENSILYAFPSFSFPHPDKAQEIATQWGVK